MADTPLAAKLQVKTGMSLLVLDAPPDVLLALHPLPDGATLHLHADPAQQHDWVLGFASQVSELDELWPQLKASLKPGGPLWIAYPKLTGKIKSDITRDHGWHTVSADDWHGVRQISVNETWSALRFRPRAEIKVMTRKFSR